MERGRSNANGISGVPITNPEGGMTMKTYHVGYDSTQRIAHVTEQANALPNSTQKLGSFDLLDDTEDDLGIVRNKGSHTVFHGVRDKLYGIGVQDLSRVDIMQV